ncbi:MAG TPA: DegT/DnrJ/EryC1/StrS family aminotransferase [Solirubrobacteraceae bacterium]|nr:DegT/DnrJ/EryC1/StrS family aminotransferase [Solirubrobacteraceae bacterium]
MKALEMVDLGAMHEEIGIEIEEAMLRVVRGGRHVGGPQVAAFEDMFASFLGARCAVALASGTDALQLALLATGVGRDDEVLVPGNTFIATAEAVVAVGATPRFVDVAADTGLIDLCGAEELITERTKAVVPVHLYGRMVDMGPVMAFANRHDLVVIEDAAQAHGASRDGLRAGTIGHVGCFSFYPGKNLGAVGDAGAAVTNDDEIANRVRLYRDHGRRGRDNHEIPGFNSRMDPIQAAALSVKLPHLQRWTHARREVAATYREGLRPFLDWEGGEAETEVHHVFPILVDDRDELASSLKAHGIPTGVHYRQAMTMTPAFAHSTDECPVAEERAGRQLSLPIHPYLSERDVHRIVDAVCRLVPAGA